MSYVTKPADGNVLTTSGALALKLKGWSTQLKVESVLNDVFDKLTGAIQENPSGFTVPNDIFMQLEAQKEGTKQLTLPMLLRLKGAAQLGTAQDMLGNEETLRMKFLTVYHNEVKKSVASYGWGESYDDVAWMGIYSQITPLMVEYFKELRGRRIREATILRFAEELTLPGVQAAQQFTPNVFIPNTDPASLDTYEANTLTLTSPTFPAYYAFSDGTTQIDATINSIATALKTATITWTKPEYTYLDVPTLLAIDVWCRKTRLMEPMAFGNQPTFVFLIPDEQMNNLLNPFGTASVGKVWNQMKMLTDFESAIPDARFRVGSLLCVTEERTPTLTVTGTTNNWILTPGFVNPGNEFGGLNTTAFATASNWVFQVGSIYGKGALVEWIHQHLKYATEQTEYTKIQGKGAYQLAGIQQAVYDEDTPTESTYIQRSSAIVLMAPPPIITVKTT
jgi:hypothetical protein